MQYVLNPKLRSTYVHIYAIEDPYMCIYKHIYAIEETAKHIYAIEDPWGFPLGLGFRLELGFRV